MVHWGENLPFVRNRDDTVKYSQARVAELARFMMQNANSIGWHVSNADGILQSFPLYCEACKTEVTYLTHFAEGSHHKKIANWL